jgi:hypothetical protein
MWEMMYMYVYSRGGPHTALAPRPSLIYCAFVGNDTTEESNRAIKRTKRVQGVIEYCESTRETPVTNYKQQIATQRSKLFLQ